MQPNEPADALHYCHTMYTIYAHDNDGCTSFLSIFSHSFSHSFFSHSIHIHFFIHFFSHSFFHSFLFTFILLRFFSYSFFHSYLFTSIELSLHNVSNICPQQWLMHVISFVFLPHIMLLSVIFKASFSLLLIHYTLFTFPSASVTSLASLPFLTLWHRTTTKTLNSVSCESQPYKGNLTSKLNSKTVPS